MIKIKGLCKGNNFYCSVHFKDVRFYYQRKNGEEMVCYRIKNGKLKEIVGREKLKERITYLALCEELSLQEDCVNPSRL